MPTLAIRNAGGSADMNVITLKKNFSVSGQ